MLLHNRTMSEAQADRLERGLDLLTGRKGAYGPEEGAALVRAAAGAGDAEACARMAVLAATGSGVAQDWAEALDWLHRSGNAEQLAVLQAEADTRGEPLDLAKLAVARAPEVKSERPRILAWPGFATRETCAWIRRRGGERLKRAMVNDSVRGGFQQDRMRTNSVAGFGLADTDLVMTLVRARIASAVGLPLSQFEAPNVLHYEPGQQFAPHVDFVAIGVPAFARELAILGQRVVTALLYLNEGYEGGETAFPLVSLRHKGAEGDLMVFHNVDERGRPDQSTVHAGTPPTSGEKWVLSQWIRDRPQPPV